MSKKVSRNDPCPCGSGEKYKKCCAKKELARQQKRLSGLKGITAKTLTPTATATFAQRVFKVLSDTVPGSSTMHKNVTKGAVEQKTKVLQQSRGYASLEELIGVEGNKTEDAPPTFNQNA